MTDSTPQSVLAESNINMRSWKHDGIKGIRQLKDSDAQRCKEKTRQRKRERESQTDRQTDPQAQTHTNADTQEHTFRHTDGQTDNDRLTG